MTAEELLKTLEVSGIRLRADGTRLIVTAPTGTFTPDLRQAIALHKAALLARLTPESKDDPIGRRISAQLSELTPYHLPGGSCGWIHPNHRHLLSTWD